MFSESKSNHSNFTKVEVMAKNKSNYKVTGSVKPIPSAYLLKPAHGSQAELKSSENVRTVKLSIYDLNGEPDEILKRIRFGGGPQFPVQEIEITRHQYVEIVERILSDKRLTDLIVSHWHKEMENFLGGADRPLFVGFPYASLVECYCDQDDQIKAAALFSRLSSILESQIVASELDRRHFPELGDIKIIKIQGEG